MLQVSLKAQVRDGRVDLSLVASTRLTRINWSIITEGTPYAGGYFRVKFKFTEEFPVAPPQCMLCE
jgi:ubiquitin-protein ligase